MRFIDFFAGIGGFRRGLELAGHECVGFCEFDKFAVASYTSMHLLTEEQREHLATLPLKQRQKEISKEEYRNGEWYAPDIRSVRAGNIPRADCWCFGFPCQDISIAGKQLGFAGKRSSLFFTITGLIKDLEEEDKPTYLLVENVKNLLSVNRGFDFAKLLVELDEIGYDAEWQVLNSKDFGVPQNRERVFIVGHLRGRSGREVFPVCGDTSKADDVQGQFTNTITTKTNSLGAGTYIAESKQQEKGVKLIGGIGEKNCNNGRQWHQQDRVYDPMGLSVSLNGQGGGGGANTGLYAIPVLTPDRKNKRQNGRRFKSDVEPMFTLTAQDRHGVAIYQRPRGNNRGGIHEIAPTITSNTYQENNYVVAIKEATKQGYAEAHEGDSINLAMPESKTRRGRVGKGCANTLDTSCNQGVLEGCRIRKLTPKECFRLQGWSDDYYEKAAFVNSDSQLYKQAGNGVTVNVIKAIGESLHTGEPWEGDKE